MPGGFGWFIDPTPGDDTEFAAQNGSNSLQAQPGSRAAAGMDLLTVVMHEIGHLFGIGDLPTRENPDDLMAATLQPGIRRLPGERLYVSSLGGENSRFEAVETSAIMAATGQAVPTPARLSPSDLLILAAALAKPREWLTPEEPDQIPLSPLRTDVVDAVFSRYAKDDIPDNAGDDSGAARLPRGRATQTELDETTLDLFSIALDDSEDE